MKNFFLLLVLFFCGISSQLSAQSNKTTPGLDEGEGIALPDFSIVFKQKVNTVNNYIYNEQSAFKRIFSDSSQYDYSRDVKYFISIRASSLPENGFQTLVVSFDSLTYTLLDGTNKVYFDSQDDEAVPPLNISDYMFFGIPLGRIVEFTYSSYGDLAKVGGKDLNELRTELFDSENSIQDSIQKSIWLGALSNDNLAFFGDLCKGIIPGKRVQQDSSMWHTPFVFYIGGVKFADTSTTRLLSFDTKEFTLLSELKKMKAVNLPLKLYGIEQTLVNPIESDASGDYLIKISPRGTIKTAEANFKGWIKYKLGKDIVKEVIDTKSKWEYNGAWRW